MFSDVLLVTDEVLSGILPLSSELQIILLLLSLFFCVLSLSFLTGWFLVFSCWLLVVF